MVTATQRGIPVPGIASALSYYDALRTERLPAALIQGQRDFLGAHTYGRTDADPAARFHTQWSGDRNRSAGAERVRFLDGSLTAVGG